MQGIDTEFAKYVAHLHEHGYLMQNPIVAAQAIHNGWIVVTVNSGWDATYDTTLTGEIALGLVEQAGDGSYAQALSNPHTDSPVAAQADSLEAEGVYTSMGQNVLAPNGTVLGAFFYGADTPRITELLNTETSALRAQVAALSGELAAAKKLLAESQVMIEQLSRKNDMKADAIQSAYEQLMDYSGEEFSLRAVNARTILKQALDNS